MASTWHLRYAPAQPAFALDSRKSCSGQEMGLQCQSPRKRDGQITASHVSIIAAALLGKAQPWQGCTNALVLHTANRACSGLQPCPAPATSRESAPATAWPRMRHLGLPACRPRRLHCHQPPPHAAQPTPAMSAAGRSLSTRPKLAELPMPRAPVPMNNAEQCNHERHFHVQ